MTNDWQENNFSIGREPRFQILFCAIMKALIETGSEMYTTVSNHNKQNDNKNTYSEQFFA